jgi:protein-S-isoprenylcysteine O-methyltransferase Ste14
LEICKLKTESPDKPGVIVFPPLLYSGTLVIALLLHWIRPWYLPHSWPIRIVGLVLVFASGALGKWGETTLKRAGTNVNPNQPSLAIVSDGPYRYTRNPLYLALVGLYLGVTIAVGTAWPLAFLVPVLLVTHFGIVRREERYLAAKFGEPYTQYLSRVRRWM